MRANTLIKPSAHLRDYQVFMNKRFEHIGKNIVETTSGKKSRFISRIGSGSYGNVFNLNDKYAYKLFTSDLFESAHEELKYSGIVNANKLRQIIPVLLIKHNREAVMMPLVDNNLLKFLENVVAGLYFYDEMNTFDNIVFDVMNSIANILFEASKIGLYYADLKLENLLCLGTGRNKFMIVVGDIGSFTYYDPKVDLTFEGYCGNVATYPPFMNNKTRAKHGIINNGHVFTNHSRGFMDKNSINYNNTHLNRVLYKHLDYVLFIFCICFMISYFSNI